MNLIQIELRLLELGLMASTFPFAKQVRSQVTGLLNKMGELPSRPTNVFYLA